MVANAALRVTYMVKLLSLGPLGTLRREELHDYTDATDD